jgi:tetratricopeptide (TPR) repeat protein
MEKAIELLLMAVRYLDHDDAIVRDHLGDAYCGAGSLEKALIEWRKALRLDPAIEDVAEKIANHLPDDAKSS